jgi:hypothetical protein
MANSPTIANFQQARDDIRVEVDPARNRQEALPVALKPQNMPTRPCIARRRHLPTALALLLGASLAGCDSPPPAAENPASSTALPHSPIASQLAGARIDTAKSKLQLGHAGEALALSISALRSDPSSAEALSLTENFLSETQWNFPELSLPHDSQIDHIALAEPASLWVALSGNSNSTVRWNLPEIRIDAVLFPSKDHATRSLILDPSHRSVVIQRGGVMLLCDADSLKPRCALPPLPEALTPHAVVVFSSDGLLLAHPTSSAEDPAKIVWHVRDTASGELIRASEPAAMHDPTSLAASLNREKLRVIRADGSLLEMPISPVEPIEISPLPSPATLLHAQFSNSGDAVLALVDSGPHAPPVRSLISYSETDDESLERPWLARKFPWSLHPSLWNGLLDDPESAEFLVRQSTLSFPNSARAGIEVTGTISAVAFGKDCAITGQTDGQLTIHRLLPLPIKTQQSADSRRISQRQLQALEALARAVSGVEYDENSRSFSRLSPALRSAARAECKLEELAEIFPHLDFANVLASLSGTRTAAPTANAKLKSRLAAADPQDASALAAATQVREILAKNDLSALATIIENAGGEGPSAASALALALQSDHAEAIQTCLDAAKNLPPLLRKISISRIAWLQNRKADALSVWPTTIPDLVETRQREDWLGWEQADFSPAIQSIRQAIADELASITVPENSSEEQRAAVATRLLDPQTRIAIGRKRFAAACLQAALAFSSHNTETETTLQLAEIARNLGAPPEPCLRAEALALTALGAYEKAHPRWIELITEHPVESHLPGDYAEAAYTAFENSDPRQAMEILNTGLHRFPKDGNFALRAGWVALLTGNSERAYQFLLAGQRIGYPPEKLENATALLTIAAEQAGASDDASVFFQDLLAIDPAWATADTLDSLEWPEELKWTLRQFMR